MGMVGKSAWHVVRIRMVNIRLVFLGVASGFVGVSCAPAPACWTNDNSSRCAANSRTQIPCCRFID